MKILVIGGGIGGLTATVALRRAGFDAHVYEQMRELGEIGAGIVLGPNAVRALDGMGFGEGLKRVGLVPELGEQRHWQTGEVLNQNVRAGEQLRQRYGFPSYSCHRAEAHEMIRAAVPDEHITLSARCVSVDQNDGQVTAHFADGTSATGDLLIGADGATSTIREHVIGPDTYVGPSKLAWRGLAPGEVGPKIGLNHPGGLSFRGQGKMLLAYYVANRRYVNWIGLMNPDSDLREHAKFMVGEREAALADFEGWAEAVRTLIASTDPVSKWLLYDGKPLPAWTKGHVTLLGDAAHPMLPFAAQGAGMSIEDAVILSRCLEKQPNDIDAALQTYFNTRWERASKVQAGGSASAAATLREDYDYKTAPPPRDQSWIWSYDALNAPLVD